jgi:hypothetical protein
MSLALTRLLLAVLAWAALLAPPASAAATTIGQASYDSALGAIVVPYTGPSPTFFYEAMGPTHHYYDLKGARLAQQTLQRPSRKGPLTRLELADHPERDAVRVVFQGPKPLRPVMRIDRSGKRVLIFPQGPGRGMAAAPAPRPTPGPTTVIGRPGVVRPGELVVPYTGKDLRWRVYGSGRDARVVYVEFTDAVFGFRGPRAGALPDRVLARWAMDRVGAHALRLTVRYHDAPRGLRIEPAKGRLRVIAAVPAARPAAPTASRPTPVPASVATPKPTPVAPRSSAVPSASPMPESSVLRPLGVVSPAARPTSRPTAQPVVNTRFARPYFDAARQVLVLPYVGAAPGYRVIPGTGRALTVEVPHAALQTPGRPGQALGSHPLLSRWDAGDVPGQGALAVSLGFVAPGDALVALDASRRQLLIFPQVASPPQASLALRAVLGRISYDARLQSLVLPYHGQAPAFTVIQVGPNHVAVDFLGAAIEPAGVQFETVKDMPLLASWLAAPRPAQVVRFSAVLPYGGHLRIQDDAPNHRLLLTPRLGPEPGATSP